MSADIEWVRARRGRNWHLVTGPDSVLCMGGLFGDGTHFPYLEVSQRLPPRGGVPCPRCVECVEELTFACLEAKAHATPRTKPARTLDKEPGLSLDSNASGGEPPTP